MSRLIFPCSLLAEVVEAPSWFAGQNLFVNWAALFLVTLALELPMVVVAWRFRGSAGPLRPWLMASIVGNLISHPLGVFAGTAVGLPGGGGMAVVNYLLIETGVIAIEAWVFRLRIITAWNEAVMMSFACNAVTAVIGAQLLFRT